MMNRYLQFARLPVWLWNTPNESKPPNADAIEEAAEESQPSSQLASPVKCSLVVNDYNDQHWKLKGPIRAYPAERKQIQPTISAQAVHQNSVPQRP
jgi:hypothetical protein